MTSRAPALEVDDIRHKRRLAAKVMAENAQFTEPLPEFHFLPRHGLAQVAGIPSSPSATPHPAASPPPSPRGERWCCRCRTRLHYGARPTARRVRSTVMCRLFRQERSARPVLVIGRHRGLVLREAAVRIAAGAGALAAAPSVGAVPPEFKQDALEALAALRDSLLALASAFVGRPLGNVKLKLLINVVPDHVPCAGAAARCRGGGCARALRNLFVLARPLARGAERRKAQGLARPHEPLRTARHACEACPCPRAIGDPRLSALHHGVRETLPHYLGPSFAARFAIGDRWSSRLPAHRS